VKVKRKRPACKRCHEKVKGPLMIMVKFVDMDNENNLVVNGKARTKRRIIILDGNLWL
jgi:hypothetical protein